ncbi:unnamed protein product [Urochloa humidicola]
MEMELLPPSGRRLHARRSPSSSEQAGEDRLGALPDALLLLILVNLGSTAEAARTSVLSRRWRSLWPELHVLVLRGVGPDTLGHILGRARHGNLRRLEIQVRSPAGGIPATQISSLLRAADEHNPAEIVFDFGHGGDANGAGVPFELPCFTRSISMDLQIGSRSFTLTPPAGKFASLETLTLSLCRVDPGEFLPRCPRLRVLAMDCCWAQNAVGIHSRSLEELLLKDMDMAALPVAAGDRTPRRVDIAAPMLRKFRLECYGRAEMVPSFSAPAPVAETLFFKYCSTSSRSIGLAGEGCLLSLTTAMEWHSRYGQVNPVLVRVLSLVILSNQNYGYANRSLAEEIVRLPVNNFSVLKLDLRTNSYNFRALVFHLLKTMDSIQRLELELNWTPCRYPGYDPDEWTNGHIWLPGLEEVEIGGMNLTDHDFDFLKVIFTYAPEIKTLQVQLSPWASQRNYKNLRRMFRENSSVKCYVNGVLEEPPRRSNRLLRMQHQSA